MNSGSWWWLGRPGVLWFMGSKRVRHNWGDWAEAKWVYWWFKNHDDWEWNEKFRDISDTECFIPLIFLFCFVFFYLPLGCILMAVSRVWALPWSFIWMDKYLKWLKNLIVVLKAWNVWAVYRPCQLYLQIFFYLNSSNSPSSHQLTFSILQLKTI